MMQSVVHGHLFTVTFLLQFRSSMAVHVSGRSMIIGGSEAPLGRYPYAVFLEDSESPYCGGSLIAPDVVLTAGHCLEMTEGVQSFSVVVGRQNVTNTSAGEVFTNVWGIPHPDYNLYEGDDNDFGLIILPNRTTDVPLIRLNPFDAIPTDGQMLTYMGWGVTSINSTDPPDSDVLLEVDAAVIPNWSCILTQGIYLGINQSYAGQITENMICTLGIDKDACQRDSGGPLIIKGDNSTGADDVQVGVISWGLGCATDIFPGKFPLSSQFGPRIINLPRLHPCHVKLEDNQPHHTCLLSHIYRHEGVSARVSNAQNWIRQEVCNRSTDPPSDFQCQHSDKTGTNHSALKNATSSSPTKMPAVYSFSSLPSVNEPYPSTSALMDSSSSSHLLSHSRILCITLVIFQLFWQ
ncbi:hypothetical protein HJC23_004180 [Cyclotella cryptica]|uniref:Peptidase S1 domain-containing protein n=1 Tax=Cyclotella cryptica TaxID=29204 RepID=A0ABD3Q7X3_9STRA